MTSALASGLDQVVAAATRLSHVDGERGELLIAGFAVEELAPRATFEQAAYLLWHGELPDPAALARPARRSPRPAAAACHVALLREPAAASGAAPMDAGEMGVGPLSLAAPPPPTAAGGRYRARRALATPRGRRPGRGGAARRRLPALVRRPLALRHGQEPLSRAPTRGAGGGVPRLLEGEEPAPTRPRPATPTSAPSVDHGLNAPPLRARCRHVDRSDMVSAVTAAGGAQGPSARRAPGPALDTGLRDRHRRARRAVLRAKLARGERLMGFGHRVYRVATRAPTCSALPPSASTARCDAASTRWRANVEATALRLLRERKPDRRLDTNVEFYTRYAARSRAAHRPLHPHSRWAASPAGRPTASNSCARAVIRRRRSTSAPAAGAAGRMIDK